ncbi:MAG: PaaI family thioesterase [Ectothiorhodospiraceae bacterium]|nr:PaaI family thioesterase [Chromatiales bacterium]MCP5154687.1 PaaI family thioesterase [Ectothiorhodospiraceae bacterium]
MNAGGAVTARITAEELQALARDAVPIAGAMGMRVEAVSAGDVLIRVPYRAEFVRPGGTVAGPVLMAAADFAMWGVVLSLVGRVELAVTTNLNINFLRRPAPEDVLARGRILKLGQRLAVGEVSLHGAEESPDSLVAHVTCTYSIPPRGTGGT